jgi:hypothetical protein
MSWRRFTGLVLLLTIALSSIEVLLADASEDPGSSESGWGTASTFALSAMDDGHPADDGSASDDCTCLCACGCHNAQPVVVATADAAPTTRLDDLVAESTPTVLVNRPRARPDTRPPLV